MDDIVTRLRTLREVLMGNPTMALEVQEAIDEIERLRTIVDWFVAVMSTDQPMWSPRSGKRH